MQSDQPNSIALESIDERTLEPVVKLLLITVGLVVLGGLLVTLPGVDRLIPRTRVSWGAVIGAVVTLAIVGVLARFALALGPFLRSSLSGPADLVADVAAVARHLVVFVAILIAHAGLEPLFEPILDVVGLAWTYDLLFLLVALGPVVVIAYRMAENVDDVAGLITDRVRSRDGETSGS